MKRTNFVPSRHGFSFENNFENQVKPFGIGKIKTDGLCGGMAFAALDYYYAGIKRPEPHPRLNQYLIERQLDSFKYKDSWRFYRWSRRDDGTVVTKTLDNEIPKVKRSIDKGEPAVIGLIGATRALDTGKKNHQVVCFGYGTNGSGHTELYVYDPNCPPFNGFSGEIVISPDRFQGSGKDVPGDSAEPIKTETGSYFPRFRAYRSRANKADKLWRGFFVQRYKPNPNPPVIRSAEQGGTTGNVRDHRRGTVRDHRDGAVRDHRSSNNRSSGGRIVRDHRTGNVNSGHNPKVRDHRTRK